MSYINWGNEPLEQKKARLKKENEDALYEQAIRVSRMNAPAIAGPGGVKSISAPSISEYKQALLPSTSLVTASIPQPDLVGDALDLGAFINAHPFIRLENGNLAVVQYCQSVLLNGILIYEAYDLETLAEINGYWVAFEQDAQNPRLLNKVAELQMTSQFWNYFYDWTVKDSGDNAVKFV